MTLQDARQKKKNKMRNRFIFRSVILFVLFAAIVFALVTNFTKDNEIFNVGDEAPDFTLEQVNKNNSEESIQLSDLRGKGVMLNFWATFCRPCEKEMPYMQELYPKYKDRGIEIVAVSLDQAELVIDQFIDKYDLTFPIPHDNKGLVRDLYKIRPIPTTYFINPEGEIVEKIEGALSLDSLEAYFNEILPE